MNRRMFVHAPAIAAHLALGCTVVFYVDGGAHPVPRPAGAVMQSPA